MEVVRMCACRRCRISPYSIDPEGGTVPQANRSGGCIMLKKAIQTASAFAIIVGTPVQAGPQTGALARK
jgi:hypothetical protein